MTLTSANSDQSTKLAYFYSTSLFVVSDILRGISVDCLQCDFRFDLFFSFSFVLILQYR